MYVVFDAIAISSLYLGDLKEWLIHMENLAVAVTPDLALNGGQAVL